jgi:D-3-phosphoglycerate dehydrogenase
MLLDSDGVIVGKDKIDEALLRNCPKLRVISKYGVGIDNIDMEACNRRNIKVLVPSGVNKRSVAEQTLFFMIGLVRNLGRSTFLLKRGIWEKDGGQQLTEKVLGIIGVGNIGKEVIRLLKPFNNKIMVNDIIDQTEYYNQNGLIEASKEEIYQGCDIISIHTPLTDLTRHMINKDTLAMMKPTAFLINTARGSIINQTHLKEALIGGRIAGVACDVYELEPPEDKEFIELDNLICTPHIGGNAREAVEAMGASAIKNLLAFFKRLNQ